jgi:hypothetical protein
MDRSFGSTAASLPQLRPQRQDLRLGSALSRGLPEKPKFADLFRRETSNAA